MCLFLFGTETSSLSQIKSFGKCSYPQSESFPFQCDRLNADVFWWENLSVNLSLHMSLNPEDKTLSMSFPLLTSLLLFWSLPRVCQAGQDLLGQAKHCPGDPAVPGTAWPIPHTPAEQCNYMFRWNNGIQNEWMPKQILPVFSNAGAKSVFPYLCWLDTYKVTI